MNYQLNIIGVKVARGPLEAGLLPSYRKWQNDFQVAATWRDHVVPWTREVADAWYRETAVSTSDVYFTVYELGTDRPIGLACLCGIDHLHRIAQFGVCLGEREVWGRGYGTEVAGLLLGYGFRTLGLHCIWLGVYSTNERAIRAYTHAGFRPSGRKREAVYLNGCFIDLLYMDCLDREHLKTATSSADRSRLGEAQLL